jgi:hypothetical protein
VLSAGGRGVDLNASGTIDSFEGLIATGAQLDIAARDGVQQTVVDLMQVVRMIQGGVDVDNTGSASLDANLVYMFGQSLELTNLVGTPAAVAVGTQSQIAVFFASNGALTIDPDGPGPLFEVPIAGPLPEDLAFIP